MRCDNQANKSVEPILGSWIRTVRKSYLVAPSTIPEDPVIKVLHTPPSNLCRGLGHSTVHPAAAMRAHAGSMPSLVHVLHRVDGVPRLCNAGNGGYRGAGGTPRGGGGPVG